MAKKNRPAQFPKADDPAPAPAPAAPIDTSETVTIPRWLTVKANKSIEQLVDMAAFGTDAKRGIITARGIGNLLGDAVADKKITAGDEANKVAAKRITAWYDEPEGGTRPPVDPFLNEVRALAVAMGLVKRSDARDTTEPMLKEAFGVKWDRATAAVRAKMERDAAEKAALLALVSTDEPDKA